jgi:hypothetical protein
MFIRASGQVNDFKCEFTQKELNLGQVSVFKKIESVIFVQNLSKLAVLHVKDLPPFTEISPMKAKFLPDETKSFKITFYC